MGRWRGNGVAARRRRNEAALWAFVRAESVDSTNNAAEQVLHGAVAEGCFGAQSAEVKRFVEGSLCVSATCRNQQQQLLTFVTETIAAYWAGRPTPTFIPSPAIPTS